MIEKDRISWKRSCRLLATTTPGCAGFRVRASVEHVIALIDARLGQPEREVITLADAAGRVLLTGVIASAPIPSFDRAAMDGYALHGEETFGANLYAPASFREVGKARPGCGFASCVKPGEAVEIATGAPLPTGADTVVPVEATVRNGTNILVTEPVPIGRHVGRSGEDVTAGDIVLAAGRVLRPQDLGVLSGLGIASVAVARRPRVVVLITGDEILPPGSKAEGHRFADMNSPMLQALIDRDGGIPRIVGPLPDVRETLRTALLDAAAAADVVLVSGGSSTGPEDHAPGLLSELGELTVHGVAIRPASPSGLGFLSTVPVLLLPGNPVSCLCAYDFFAGRVIRKLGGRRLDWPYRTQSLPLARKLVSAVGRVDYLRVRLIDGRAEPMSIGGASILTSTTRADGFVVIPAGLEGYPAGVNVTVHLYQID